MSSFFSRLRSLVHPSDRVRDIHCVIEIPVSVRGSDENNNNNNENIKLKKKHKNNNNRKEKEPVQVAFTFRDALKKHVLLSYIRI